MKLLKLTLFLPTILLFLPAYGLVKGHNSYTYTIEASIENELVRDYMLKVSYPEDDYSFSMMKAYADSNIFSSPRKDEPRSIDISWAPDSTLSSYSFTISDTLDFAKTYTIASRDAKIQLWNLVPGRRYKYLVSGIEVSGKVRKITCGYIRPIGQVRMIYVPSIYNVRDLGGWKSSIYKHPDGSPKTIVYGRLFRGGEMDRKHNISENDKLILLNDLQLGAEMDFRNEKECKDIIGSALGDNVVYKRLSTQSYIKAINDDCIAKDFLFVLAQLKSGKNVYFHCVGGADRTGTMAFVIEAVLGLSESDLSKDYELTSMYAWRSRILGEKYNFGEMVKAYKEQYEGATIHDKCCNFLMKYGVSKEQLNEFRTIMLE